MLLVLLPVALVPGTLHVGVDAKAVRFIVHPLAVVDVTISMEELSLATCLIILPISFIVCSIDPDHISTSVAQAALPLTSVHSTGAVGVYSILKARIILIGATECLPGLI